MIDWQLKTPVCLIVFRRPDVTEKVFEAIRQVKPPMLLVVADGSRSDRPGEAERCAAVRSIIDRVDWKCEVLKNYSDVNMGLKHRVSSGLDWVFKIVEEAIILEDDCLPHPTFFRFCEELLEYYKNDERVMLITGTNFQFGLKQTDYSYYFSRYIDCWGWATWKRAWQHYDFEMKNWSEIRDNNWLYDLLQDPQEVESWTKIFQYTYDGLIDSWAYRWKLACWAQSGLTIIPNTNLVSNIGFNADAVHTKDSRSPFANTPIEAMNFPLNHPQFLIRDVRADEFTKQVMFAGDYSELRKRLATCWLNLNREELASQYNQDSIKNLLNSSIRDIPLSDTEIIIQKELLAQMYTETKDEKAIQCLLASMLYCYPHQLPVQYDISLIPEWLLNDYLKFMLEPPRLFREFGEINNYYWYMQKWVNYLHNNIFSNPDSKLWQQVAILFTQYVKYLPLYFNTANLKDICTKRAEIMEFALKIQGYQVNYDFSERLPGRDKIRLGIIADNFGMKPETFTTLPIYKHLNRDKFEIILYSLQASGHRLERYCSGHADGGVQLPEDLDSQVKTIRNDDLDILFIADNITDRSHSITWLSLHRLARVQVVSINSLVTSGISNVDYYISGKLTEPENDAQQHYTETLITLDGSALCFDFATEEQVLNTISISREKLGIDENSIVYVSGADFNKIIPEVEAAWAKIIASVPNSRLVLYPFNLSWSSSYPVSPFKKRLEATFAQHSLGEDKFIILDPVQNRADVKQCFKLGDIYLDSYPCSEMTSLITALELGLPTVVMEGNSSRSRIGSSLLRDIEMFDLIADAEDSYIQLAVTLGIEQELRQQKSGYLQEKMRGQPKFLDSRSYSAQIELLFQQIFLKHLSDSLNENLRLRDFNLIVFPDWSQSEESLSLDLANAIRAIATHPDSSQMTLLVENGNVSEEDAALILSSASMNLLMEEDLDVSEGLEFSFVGQLGTTQWEALLPKIKARIVLENENQQAIAAAKAETIPFYGVDSFSSDINSSYQVSGQNA